MQTELSKLRDKLEVLNSDLFFTWARRKALIAKIQELKDHAYDFERERSLFQTPPINSLLKGLRLKELLAFSLLMEDHAGAGYPEWSRGEHLEEPGQGPEYQINPLLLALERPELFCKLKLKKEWSALMAPLLNKSC